MGASHPRSGAWVKRHVSKGGCKETKFMGKKLLKNVDLYFFIGENGVCQLSPFPNPPPPFFGGFIDPPP